MYADEGPSVEDARPDTPDDSPQPPVAAEDDHHGSLRGTFVAVVAMASFFVVTWFGMFLLALDRR